MSLARYAGVGVVATAVHYALLGALVEGAAWAPGPAAFCGAVLGAVVAYLGNRHLTFTRSSATHARAAPRFAVVAALGSVGNGLLVGAGAELGLHYLLAQVLATVVVMAVTYHANRWWTFA